MAFTFDQNAAGGRVEIGKVANQPLDQCFVQRQIGRGAYRDAGIFELIKKIGEQCDGLLFCSKQVRRLLSQGAI
jgi:hypothetical protein